MNRIVRDSRVVEFVSERVGGYVQLCRPIGLERNGKIVAGAIFHSCNGHAVWYDGAADEPVTRKLLQATWATGFEMAPQILTKVAETNVKALAFDMRNGFEVCASLPSAAHDGSDLIILRLLPSDCKYNAISTDT